ncbi:glycoside hydrolase family 3 N-terminal domain-containing protein [Sulfurospirillum deleyianum]|uniref:beta-N-acetylhexosaminidase n=1 Tax=Sulfurospirillum deleyianum (strain ATCC 51133 / DSM 6946 / 5175) TaxID=525898 RepID=D1B232_SULD5|nr:glycoside hydrolase family 3 N-terminal domain-containing protein [Sulfurospirillum deleyianum]ACZ12152.1 glycoside hydrolase family 3 domain protein [Sulfurospirillum deleyianum DSM 6946]
MMRLFLAFLLLIVSVYAKTPSLETMVSQMIVIGFDGEKEGDKWVEQVAKDIKREKIGGIFLSQKNIHTPEQVRKLTAYLKKQTSKTPLMVAVEFDGSTSLEGFTPLLSPREMVEKSDILEAEARYIKSAQELADAGINLNFAPTLDLQSDVKSEQRYSALEEVITTYAMLFSTALTQKGVLPVVKYFPSAGENIWNNFSTEATLTSWRFEQLKPYYDLIAFGKMDAVLISHAMCEDLDEKNPMLFSSKVIETLLRQKMHFEGVVFANHLRTNSLSSKVDFKQRILRSLHAGVDVFVFPNYFGDDASIPFTVQRIIMEGVRKGEIRPQRIELSYKRIMALKQKMAH